MQVKQPKKTQPKWRQRMTSLSCMIGMHDFDIVEVTYTFSNKGTVEKLQCKHCGLLITKQIGPKD